MPAIGFHFVSPLIQILAGVDPRGSGATQPYCRETRPRPPVGLPSQGHSILLGEVGEPTALDVAQYIFGFAWGSFQYGRVVTYFNFASKRSFRNSFSVSSIFARILLAVVGPTPYTELANTARFP